MQILLVLRFGEFKPSTQKKGFIQRCTFVSGKVVFSTEYSFLENQSQIYISTYSVQDTNTGAVKESVPALKELIRIWNNISFT